MEILSDISKTEDSVEQHQEGHLRLSKKERYKARKLCVEGLYIEQYRVISLQALVSLQWLTGSNLPSPTVITYYQKLIHGVCEYREEIDRAIELFTPKYSQEQMFKIDRAILELGIFMLLYHGDMPSATAIDESIRLAKEYGGVEAHKFINGVLDSVYHSKTHHSKGGAGS